MVINTREEKEGNRMWANGQIKRKSEFLCRTKNYRKWGRRVTGLSRLQRGQKDVGCPDS